MSYPLKEIDDFDRCLFSFPPIYNSTGREYLYIFSCPVVPPGHGIALWYNRGDSIPGGEMFINSAPAGGSLYFQAYCFTGERPETNWQGKKEIVIDQGW